MIHTIIKNKATRLFIILSGIFIATALLAEFIGVKIFSVEASFGLAPANIKLWGETYSFNLTCGVLLWPIVFIMTDIINEYYGPKGVKFLSWLAVILIAFGFFMVFGAIKTAPAAFWISSKESEGVSNMNLAYNAIFGQGLGIIIASLIAFLVGQIIDVFIFHKIKTITGEKRIWLRATGSTLVSQLIDSFVVLLIAFYFYPMWVSGQGQPWPIYQLLAIGIVNYIYKFCMAILLTPVLIGVHHWIDSYLGEDLAALLKEDAMKN